MDLKKEKEILIISTTLAVIGVLICIFVFSTLKNKEQKVYDVMRQIDDYSAEKINLSSVKARIEETSAKRDKLDSYFVAKDGVVSFLNYIQSLVPSDNLNVKILSVGIVPADGKTKDVFDAVNVEVIATGLWGDVAKFAGSLETIPYQVSVQRANLEYGEFSENASTNAPLPKKWRGTFHFSVLKIK